MFSILFISIWTITDWEDLGAPVVLYFCSTAEYILKGVYCKPTIAAGQFIKSLLLIGNCMNPLEKHCSHGPRGSKNISYYHLQFILMHLSSRGLWVSVWGGESQLKAKLSKEGVQGNLSLLVTVITILCYLCHIIYKWLGRSANKENNTGRLCSGCKWWKFRRLCWKLVIYHVGTTHTNAWVQMIIHTNTQPQIQLNSHHL